jgi:PknH-like extracellular domain
MTHRQRRRVVLASGTAAVALMLVACGSHTPSWFPVQPQKTSKTHAPDAAPATSVSAPKPLPANSIKTLVLPTEDVTEIAGLALQDRSQFDSPNASSGDYSKPECALTLGITKDALGDGEFTAYRSVRNQASKDDGLVGMFTQNVATFETSDKASEIFHKAYAPLGHCNSASISAKNNPATWKVLAPGPFNGDTVIFGALQFTDKNQPLGWRCDHQAHVKDNVIVEASMCAWANGAPAAAAAVDQISARIPPPDKPAPPAPADFLAASKIKSLIVGVPEASKILGANLGDSSMVLYPPAARDFGDKSNCSALEGPDANSFGPGVDYTAYRGTDYREAKDNYQHIVDQQVATYLDAQTASRYFHDAFKGLDGCDGALVPGETGSHVQFQLKAPDITDDRAQWVITGITNGQPDPWRCAFNFRAQSNVLFVAKVCQNGDPAEIASQLADQMAAHIPK